jgi:hypothetical protein
MLARHLRVDFSHCSFRAPKWFSAWARNDNGHIVGIFAVEFPTWFEGRVNVLVLDPRCLSRRILRAIFTALFAQVKRLTAEVEPDNRRAVRQVQRLGFQFEGYRPLGLEGARDTIVFGMLREECLFLPTTSISKVPDTVVRDAEAARERGRRLFRAADYPDLLERQLGVGGHITRSVTDLVGHVVLMGGPSNVPSVDARSRTAAMGGFVVGRG